MARMPSLSRRAVIGAATCALATAALCAAAAPAAVNYPNFLEVPGLQLNGSAGQVPDVLRLTPNAMNQTGTAFTKKRVVKPNANFKTSFQISQHNGSGTPGDGMTFTIQSVGKSLVGDGGGGLGYGGIGHSLAIEFDLYDNGDDDPDVPHIGLTKNGRAGVHLEAENPGWALYPNAPYVWVNYTAKSKVIKVYASPGDTKPAHPLFTHRIKLNDVLDGEKGFAGFTAATGSATATQDVLSWKLKSG